MAKKKRKFPKRKRQFNLQTKEGKELALMNQKLYDAFPDKEKRKIYLQTLIKEFDKRIVEFPEE